MEDIQTLLKRPKLYDNIDGSSELMLGFMLTGFTAYQWIGLHMGRESIWNSVWGLNIFVALLVTALIFGQKALKNLITYRRTGFVKYQKPHLWWLLRIGFLSAAVAFGLMFFILRKQAIDSTVLGTIGTGLLFAATYAYGIARTARWKWIVAAFPLIGAFFIAMLPGQVASAPIQPWLDSALNRRLLGSLFWCNATYAIILLVSGCISLALYLHSTRGTKME